MTTLPIRSIKQTVAPFRLRRHADYQRVYKASRKYHSVSMSYFFRVRPLDELPQVTGPRIGLTVGRVMGKAVDRNRIKRRMREAIRLHLEVLHDAPPAQGNLDLVLHPRKQVAEMDFEALQREVRKLLTQVVAQAAHPPPPPPERPARRPSGATGKAAGHPAQSSDNRPLAPASGRSVAPGPQRAARKLDAGQAQIALVPCP